MMIFKNNLEGQNLSDPQDLRRKIKPLVSVRKRRNIQNPAFITPLPPQTIVERLVLDRIKVRTLIYCYQQERSMQAMFVKGEGITPTPIVTRKGIEVEWTAIEEDTTVYEVVTELYPRPSLVLRRKIGKNKEICYLKRFIGTNLDIQRKTEFQPCDYPLPKQTNYEILNLEASEEERDQSDMLNFIAAVGAFNLWKEKNEKIKKNKLFAEKRIKEKKKKDKKNGKEEKNIKKKLSRRLREKIVDLHYEVKGLRDQDFLKKKKNVNICPIHPEKISSFGLMLEDMENRGIKERFFVPTMITYLLGGKTMKVTPGELLDLFIFYNLCYIVYWTCRAFNVYLSRGYFVRLYEKYKEIKNIKKMICLPFEDFLNNDIEGFEDYQQTKKKIKKIKKINKKLNLESYPQLRRSLETEKLKKLKAIKKIGPVQYLNLRSGMDSITSLDTYVSFLFSLYMGKKCIFFGRSDDLKCIETHKKLMSREPKIDADFRSFVVEETSRLFRDYHYMYNPSLTPPITSYNYQGEDVNLHNFLVENSASRSDFQNFWREDLLTGYSSEIYNDFMNEQATHHVKVIHEKGKTRVITTNHPATFLIKNFQFSVHRHLKLNPTFFYIGKQVRKRIDILPRAKDEWVLSGDYENSTDFIPSELTSVIYDVILSKLKGRLNLKRIVRHSLKDELLKYPDGEELIMRSGQLMGGLLSFPALCIMNHCISKYLGINKKKVNGDDLLALTRKSNREQWIERSAELGMSPNDSKSHFHPKYGTFNSQLIALKGNNLYHLPHFSITKLSNSNLGDIMNVMSGCYDPEICPTFGRVWLENHTHFDMYKGNILSNPERNLLRPYDSFFFFYYNVVRQQMGSTIGSVGIFSRHYDPENIEAMIDSNWSTEYTEERFAVGNGVICSLRELWRKKDPYFFFILKNFSTKRTDSVVAVHTDHAGNEV